MDLRLSQRFKTCFKMLRHFFWRTRQSQIMSWACCKLLSHATKSYRVNRPLRLSFTSEETCFRADLHGTIFVACDNGLRQAHDMICDCRVRQEKCRSILKHVLKRYDNRKSCRRPVLGPIYKIRFCRMRQAHDRPATRLTIVAAF